MTTQVLCSSASHQSTAHDMARAQCARQLFVWLLVATVHLAACEESQEALESENEALRQRLQALEGRLKDEEQFSYVVTKGFIGGAENVYMETMEIQEAKQWCNAHAECKGFTFLGGEGEQEPDDEVTVTFKGEPAPGESLETFPDQAYISYVKQTTAFGALGGAGMQIDGDGHALVSHGLTFNIFALAFTFAIACVFLCRKRQQRRSSKPLLPLSGVSERTS